MRKMPLLPLKKTEDWRALGQIVGGGGVAIWIEYSNNMINYGTFSLGDIA